MFDVTGYPTLKWLPKGKTNPADTEVVKAPRTADGLAKFITDKTGVMATTPAQVCINIYIYIYRVLVLYRKKQENKKTITKRKEKKRTRLC